MTKLTFLKRLKKMLIRYPDDACRHCPGALYYTQEEPDLDACEFCAELITGNFLQCPCAALGQDKALSRAWSVINAWEAEHGSLT